MLKKLLVAITITAALSGCASVPMASPEKNTAAKQFAVKPEKSNVYIYRNETFGAAIKLPIVFDGRILGDTASKTFFLVEADPGKHVIVSKGEADSTLELMTQAGKNYFVWQEVKMGVFAARSLLQLVDEPTGKAGVQESQLASPAP